MTIKNPYEKIADKDEIYQSNRDDKFTLNISRILYVLLVVLVMVYAYIWTSVYSFHTPKEASWQACLSRTSPSLQQNDIFLKESISLQFPLKSGETVKIPLFTSHPFDLVSSIVEHIVLVQHGNIRNSADYFCGAVNSSKLILPDLNTLILAPYFLVDNDTCWDKESMQMVKVDSKKGYSCGFPVWSSEGWKDGHESLNIENFFSYDVFSLLVDYISESNRFPRLSNITLFGFSAGGQTMLRYSFAPSYLSNRVMDHLYHDITSKSNSIFVKYVISDPSTYLYLNEDRPRTSRLLTESDISNPSPFIAFGVPNQTWISSQWNVSKESGKPWISSWNHDCKDYNKWRFGLESTSKYFLEHQINLTQSIEAFGRRHITYLIGTSDSFNCDLDDVPHCQDNELVTSCSAMLQGGNRLDRAIKYWSYLAYFYHGRSGHQHRLVFAPNVGHDPLAMMTSTQGRCQIFGLCIEANQNLTISS